MLEDVRAVLGDDAVIRAVVGVFSAETIASGEPIRAADMLVVAEQLDAAIGPKPVDPEQFKQWRPSWMQGR